MMIKIYNKYCVLHHIVLRGTNLCRQALQSDTLMSYCDSLMAEFSELGLFLK